MVLLPYGCRAVPLGPARQFKVTKRPSVAKGRQDSAERPRGLSGLNASPGAGRFAIGDTAKLWTNFLDCVKTRNRPYSPIDIAVRVQAPLNMGILSHRENKVARFDKRKQQIVL
jgi:hypothetical protein